MYLSFMVNISRIGVALCLILFLNLLLSCKRENAYVHGQAQEIDTQKPIKGVEVHLIQGYRDAANNPQKKIVQTTYTDADGQYMLRYRRALGTEYWVKATHNLPEYYDNTGFYEQLDGRKKAKTIALYPKAYLRIRIKKTGYTDDYVYFGEAIKKDFNKPYDTILPKVETVRAGTNPIYYYIVPDPYSGAVEYWDKFNAIRGDTVTYLIQFE